MDDSQPGFVAETIVHFDDPRLLHVFIGNMLVEAYASMGNYKFSLAPTGRMAGEPGTIRGLLKVAR
jgi:hypothetical protein